MPSSNKSVNLRAVYSLLALLLCALYVAASWSVTSAQGVSVVIDDQQFRGDYGSYRAGEQIGSTGWIAYGTHSAALEPLYGSGNGVLLVSTKSTLRKTWVLTQTGTYLLKGRVNIAPKSVELSGPAARDIKITRVGDGVTDYAMGTIRLAGDEQYYSFVSDVLNVTYPNYILTIELSGSDNDQFLYYDFLQLTVGPDLTTPAAYATSGPTPTCVDAATGVHIVLPTPTPSVVDWSFNDHFSGGWRWDARGDVGVNRQYNHYADYSGEPQSVQIKYQHNITPDTTSVLTNYLFLTMPYPSMPAYVAGWVQAPVLTAGVHAYLDVWALDGGDWIRQGSTEIGAGAWYPFSITVTEQYSVTSIAFTGWRTDAAVSSYFVVDDVAVSGSTRYRPRCDGSFLTAPTNFSPGTPNGTAITISWPVNKPCPGNITQPNNFFGSLLAGLTMLLDVITKWAPAHDPLFSLSEMATNLMAGPIGQGIAIINVYIDPTIPLLAAAAWIVLQLARGIISMFLWIKRLIPFIN